VLQPEFKMDSSVGLNNLENIWQVNGCLAMINNQLGRASAKWHIFWRIKQIIISKYYTILVGKALRHLPRKTKL
jgi:hypothetical protein